MRIDEKKQLIYEFVKLGIEQYEAILLAECDDDEIETLNNDPIFQKRSTYNKLKKEEELLLLHDEAIRIAIDKGDSKGIQWRLEKLKPEKYSRTVFNNVKADIRTENEHSFKNLSDKEKEERGEELLSILKTDIDNKV